MQQEPYKFALRLPVGVRDRIVEAAGRYRRSINSEIVARLEQSFREGPVADGAPPLNRHLEYVLRGQLDENEQRLLEGFRHLEQKKRTALLDLLD